MTDKYQALREAAAKATPGPYVAMLDFNGMCFVGRASAYAVVAERINMSDAHFIAAASPDVVTSLLSDLDAANARAEKAERERDEWRVEVECECCGGVGTIDERLGGFSFSNPAAKCPDCDGNGVVLTPMYAAMKRRAEKAEREREDLSAKLDAMTNQAVMLSGRRATIVDASDADKITALESEVKRLREALPSELERSAIDTCVHASCYSRTFATKEGDDTRHVVRAWMARLDAARGGAK